MPRNCCPACGSHNTAVGIAGDSTNVAIVCNSCNFRDVLYFGDSRQDAYRFWRLCLSPRSMRDRASRFRVQYFVSPVRPLPNQSPLERRRRSYIHLLDLPLRMGRRGVQLDRELLDLNRAFGLCP